MSNDLLAKFKAKQAGSTEAVTSTEATKPTPKPAPISHDTTTSSQSSKLSALLAKRKTGVTMTKEAEEQKQVRLAAEKEVVTKATDEVPENIYTVGEEVKAIDGLDAEVFSTLLANTHKAIVNDEPMLPKFLEEINRNMRQYEELVYLLTPEQLSLFVDGTMKYKQLAIKTTAPKSNAAKTQKALLQESGGKLELL